MIAVLATYTLWVMVAGYVAVWLFAENLAGKLWLGLSAIAGLVIVLVAIKVAGASYYDPRPFVVDPSIVPLISHAPDNGFPSDHAAAAGLIAMVVGLRHRLLGVAFGVVAIVVAWARVSAHVHHLQDVAAGLALGVAAALLGALLVRALLEHTRFLSWPPLARFRTMSKASGPGTV